MYNLMSLQGIFATDTFHSYMKYLYGNTFCQVYSHKVGLSACYPKLNLMGGNLVETLDDLFHDFGVSEHLTFDGFQSQVGKIQSSTRICVGIGLITISLHRTDPMKILLNVP